MRTSTIALGAAALAAGVTVYFITRPAKAQWDAPVGPLRPLPPPPGAPEPGPAAQRIADFIEDLDDNEIINLRGALPAHWWSYVTFAATQPDDAMVAVVLNPATIDYAIMSPEQREQMQTDIVAGIGILNAFELQSILQDNGVIPT